MADFISREAAKAKKIYSVERRELVVPVAEIDWIPPADVVARDAFNRILAENDTMRNQLAEVGKKVGDTMDDVRPVVLCRDCKWFGEKKDSLRGCCALLGIYPAKDWYCAFGTRMTNCGADMRPDKNDQKGEQQVRENRKTLR